MGLVAFGSWLHSRAAVPASTPADTLHTGRWSKAPDPSSRALGAARLKLLRSLGYASGSDPAPPRSGVLRYDAAAAQAGLNLIVSSHAAAAVLVDMGGHALHRWSLDFERVWPNYLGEEYLSARYWRRVLLLPDGGLIAIHEGIGLVRLDRDSKVLWKLANGAHHEVMRTPGGDLLTIARRVHIVPRIDPKRPIAEDVLEFVSMDGRPLRTISLLEAFERSRFASALKRTKAWGDLFHTNSVQWIDPAPGAANGPLAAGGVLVSIRELNLLALVDLPTGTVTWTASGEWRAQHEAVRLANGHILLFDNRGLGQRSRVLEIDPATLGVRWSYGERDGEVFYSRECGLAQRLANGNTLVTASDRGRAFEVTPRGRIVWEYVSPWRAGDKRQFIATLFQVQRIAPGAVADWLPAAASRVAGAG